MSKPQSHAVNLEAAMSRLNGLTHPSDGGDFVEYRKAQAEVLHLQAEGFRQFAAECVAQGNVKLGESFRRIAESSMQMSVQIEQEVAGLVGGSPIAAQGLMSIRERIRMNAIDPEDVFRELKADADRLKDAAWPSLCLPAHRRNGTKKVRLSGSALVARGLRRAALAMRRANR